jgi:hypothetical protein
MTGQMDLPEPFPRAGRLPGGFRVREGSGRRDGNLHTNFTLNESGGYLVVLRRNFRE